MLREIFEGIPLLAFKFLTEGTEACREIFYSTSRFAELMSLYYGNGCIRLMSGFSSRESKRLEISEWFSLKNLSIPTPRSMIYRSPTYSQSHVNELMIDMFRQAASAAPRFFPSVKTRETNVVLAFLSLDGLPLRKGGTPDPRGPCIVGLEKTYFVADVEDDKAAAAILSSLHKDSFNACAEEFLLHSFSGFVLPVAVHFGGGSRRRSRQMHEFMANEIFPVLQACAHCRERNICCVGGSVSEACNECRMQGKVCERILIVATVSDAESNLRKFLTQWDVISIFDGAHNAKNLRRGFDNYYVMTYDGHVFSNMCFRALKHEDPDFLRRAGIKYADLVMRDRHSTSAVKRLVSSTCVEALPSGMISTIVYPPRYITASIIDNKYFSQCFELAAFDDSSGQFILLGRQSGHLSYTAICCSTIPRIVNTGTIPLKNVDTERIHAVKFTTMALTPRQKFRACWILCSRSVIVHVFNVRSPTKVVEGTNEQSNDKEQEENGTGSKNKRSAKQSKNTPGTLVCKTRHCSASDWNDIEVNRTLTDNNFSFTIVNKEACTSFRIAGKTFSSLRSAKSNCVQVYESRATQKTTGYCVPNLSASLTTAYTKEFNLLASYIDMSIKLWDMSNTQDPRLIQQISVKVPISCLFFVGRSIFVVSKSELILWTDLKAAVSEPFRLIRRYLEISGMHSDIGRVSLDSARNVCRDLRVYLNKCIDRRKRSTGLTGITGCQMSFACETRDNIERSEDGFARLCELVASLQGCITEADMIDASVFATLVLEGLFGIARSGSSNDQMPSQYSYSTQQRPVWMQRLVSKVMGMMCFVQPRSNTYYSDTSVPELSLAGIAHHVEEKMKTQFRAIAEEAESRSSKWKEDMKKLNAVAGLFFCGDRQQSIRSFQKNPYGTLPVAFRESQLERDFQTKMSNLNESGETEFEVNDSPAFPGSEFLLSYWGLESFVATLAPEDGGCDYWLGQIVRNNSHDYVSIRWLIESGRGDEEIYFRYEDSDIDDVDQGAILGGVDLEPTCDMEPMWKMTTDLEADILTLANSSRAAIYEAERKAKQAKETKQLTKDGTNEEMVPSSIVAKSYRSNDGGKRRVRAPVAFGEFWI